MNCRKAGVFILVFSFMFIHLVSLSLAVDYTISGSQTTQQNVSTGDTVTITGTGNLDVTGANLAISGAAADNVEVTVQSGGNIEAEGADGASYNTIQLRDNAIVTIEASATATNEGRESLGAKPQNVISLGDNATVDVSGTITAENWIGSGWNNHAHGIIAGDDANITVNSTGTITSEPRGGKAIDVGTNGVVTNAGTLVARELQYDDDRWGVVSSDDNGGYA